MIFASPFTTPPGPVAADGSGTINTIWTPRDSAGTYTLTGVRSVATPLNTLGDSLGKIALRRTVTVMADIPNAAKSTMSMNAVSIGVGLTATVTIKVNDQFGNPVKTATGASFVITAVAGTLSPATCTQGVCTVTYTAPAAAGPDTVSVKILGVDILFSPMALTIERAGRGGPEFGTAFDVERRRSLSFRGRPFSHQHFTSGFQSANRPAGFFSQAHTCKYQYLYSSWRRNSCPKSLGGVAVDGRRRN